MKKPMRRRSKLMIWISALLIGGTIYFQEGIASLYYAITAREHSFVKRSSPLRKPLEEVWNQWKMDDQSRSPAASLIEETIARELPVGSNGVELYRHFRRHFKRASVHVGGYPPETIYSIDCYGTEGLSGMEVLQLLYLSQDDKFLGAELRVAQFKGLNPWKISLRSSNGEMDHRKPESRESAESLKQADDP